MITARSQGLPAITVPGDDAWQPEWAQLLDGRRVSVVMDCDHAGRDTARRIVGNLKRVGVSGSMVDLARGRSDGYDLSDWLHDRASRDRRELARALGAPRPSGASDRAQR